MSFLAPNENEDINIPSILIVPQIQNLNNQIVIESNNLESENLQEIIEQGIQTGIKLVKLTSVSPGPIVIPLIPSKVNYPYLQQLSRECFDLSSDDKYYRIDDFGQPAPMHDMSYFEKSVPREIGIQQHSILGSNLFSRAESSVQILHNFGIDVHYKLILGRVHNDNSGLGVNELGDKFVADTYKSTIEERKKIWNNKSNSKKVH